VVDGVDRELPRKAKGKIRMSETLSGEELFDLVMHPRAKVEEIATLDLEALSQKVRYRRRKKVPKGALSPFLTDEQIARAILDYARCAMGKAPIAQPPASVGAVCPDCGGPSLSEDIFCVGCGALLPSESG
jgi:hypothetical protein